MTKKEAITQLHWLKAELIKGTDLNEPLDMAIEALSAGAPIKVYETFCGVPMKEAVGMMQGYVNGEYVKVVRCKDCLHYEQDVWKEVDGVPIIVAHHICDFWNGACYVKPDGFCSFGERAEQTDELLTHEQAWGVGMTDRIKQCDVVDSCEDCPRYADDCDGGGDDE